MKLLYLACAVMMIFCASVIYLYWDEDSCEIDGGRMEIYGYVPMIDATQGTFVMTPIYVCTKGS